LNPESYDSDYKLNDYSDYKLARIVAELVGAEKFFTLQVHRQTLHRQTTKLMFAVKY
jgi:hypothetical protein